jgi:ribonuclease-3
MKLQRLQKILGYDFRQPDYLRQALTHCSAGARNNERLEFLGDAILGFEVAEILYRMHPDAAEGQLSRARSQLVKRETLASVARQLELGEYLILGTGELASGGQNRDSILSDAVEAIIAAVYIDGGMEQARAFVRFILGEFIDKSEPGEQLKDNKTRLQEYLQSKKIDLPMYEVLSISGDPHEQRFYVQCEISSLQIKTTATATNRRKGEQQAANAMLNKLETES